MSKFGRFEDDEESGAETRDKSALDLSAITDNK